MDTDLENGIYLTFDVEWAADAVIDDVVELLARYGVTATFFVTHAGVTVTGHERGLHPNFRRTGTVYREHFSNAAAELTDAQVYEEVTSATLTFAPEAKGVRSHSLLFDSALLPIYRRLGIEYDSSYRLELVPGIQPFLKQYDILEIPAYYADYYDVVAGRTSFELANLQLGRSGLKVFDFHPNLIYMNASSITQYEASRSYFGDPARLLAARGPGKGVRTLFLELLEYVATSGCASGELGRVNAAWRERHRD